MTVNVDTFWDAIDLSSIGRTMDHKEAKLRSALLKLSIEDLLSFEHHLTQANRALYTWDMYRAATVVLGFTSDDVFADFRTYVISQGRRTFEAVREDTDKGLASIPFEDLEDVGAAEELSALAGAIYEHRTGRHIFEDFPDRLSPDQPASELAGPDPGPNRRSLAARYPLLTAAHQGRPGQLPQWPMKLAMAIGRLRNRKR